MCLDYIADFALIRDSIKIQEFLKRFEKES